MNMLQHSVLYLAIFASPAVCAQEANPVGEAAGRSAYVGQESRSLKSFSDAEIDALRSGAGAGYARTAELNGWPGPKHVIELAAELNLSESQLVETKALFQRMQQQAVELGERMLDAETRLERLFDSGSPTPEAIRNTARDIAVIEGELRAVHLVAHLGQADILDPDQRRRYFHLRGYGNSGGHDNHVH